MRKSVLRHESGRRIFFFFFCTASVRSRILEQPIFPGIFIFFYKKKDFQAFFLLMADGSEADHCFGPGSLRAPPMVANEAKMDIVFS